MLEFEAMINKNSKYNAYILMAYYAAERLILNVDININ